MDNLQMFIDSLAGYLVGTTIVEVVIKPSLIRFGKKTLKNVDEQVGVVPDWMWSDSGEGNQQE